jgi:FlgD Ig-like domain
MKQVFTNYRSVVIFAILFTTQTLFAQTTIFTENFESGTASSSWGLYRAGEENIKAVPASTAPDTLAGSGKYIGYLQDIDGSYSGAAQVLAGDTSLTNYSIEADVYLYVGQSPSAYTGIVVYGDSTRKIFYKLVADFTNSRFRLYNNKISTVTFSYSFVRNFTGTDIPVSLPTTSGWHKLKLEVKTISATRVRFWSYYDGNLLGGTFVDDTSSDVNPKGQFGLYSFQNDTNGVAGYYDNVVVKTLTTTSVKNPSQSQPREFSLLQNYPNPFNPSTKITYRLNASGFTTLGIYNILGRKIKSLVAQEQAPGEYSVSWNGNDERGQTVASGVYFYTLQNGTYAETKKLILMK